MGTDKERGGGKGKDREKKEKRDWIRMMKKETRGGVERRQEKRDGLRISKRRGERVNRNRKGWTGRRKRYREDE